MPSTRKGIVLSVLIGDVPGTLLTRPVDRIVVDFEGVVGDQHRGYTRPSDSRTPWYPRGTIIRNDRQISLVSQEDLQYIAGVMQVPEVRVEWLGANLLITGIEALSRLSSAVRLVFSGGVVISQLQENNPCIGPGKQIAAQYGIPDLASRFPQAAIHRRGLIGSIEIGGMIAPGEEISVVKDS